LATRVSYPVDVKMKAIEMRLAGVSVKEVMEQLIIRNRTQLKTWMRWYRAGENQRLKQPVGKQYSVTRSGLYINTSRSQRDRDSCDVSPPTPELMTFSTIPG